LGKLDQQLADVGDADEAEILRASARALLVVAFRQKNYDVRLLPASRDFGLRVRNTTSGLQAEVTDAAETADGTVEDPDTTVAGSRRGAEPALGLWLPSGRRSRRGASWMRPRTSASTRSIT